MSTSLQGCFLSATNIKKKKKFQRMFWRKRSLVPPPYHRFVKYIQSIQYSTYISGIKYSIMVASVGTTIGIRSLNRFNANDIT